MTKEYSFKDPAGACAAASDGIPKHAAGAALGTALLLALFFISRNNYLLFHGLAELFSVAVAWGVFMMVWNARHFVGNDALVMLGAAYLFVGLLDLLHTLAYKGMGVFPGPHSANLATQLWIAARYMESLSLLAFAALIGKNVRPLPVLSGYAGVTALLLLAVFSWGVFPDCYLADTGLTPFKKGSEYIVCLILLLSLAVLWRKKAAFHPSVFYLMTASILVTMVGELAFTFYVSVYGLSNLVGHYAKILSFFLIYLALIRSGLTRPYEVLFKEWKSAETALTESRRALQPLMGNLPGIAFRCVNDKDWTMSYLSDGCMALTGYDPEDFIGSRAIPYADIIHPDDRSRVWDEIQTALKTGNRYEIEYRIVDRLGREKWVWERGQNIPDSRGGRSILEGFIADITDRKENEARERLQALVLDQIHEQVTVTDLSGTITYVNDAELKMLGAAPGDLIGRKFGEAFGEAPESGAPQREILERTLALGRWRGEVVNATKSGGRRILELRTQVVNDARGEAFALCGISTDITERRKREEELRRLASAIDQTAESIMITEPDGTIVFVNPSFERLTGYRREEVIGKNPRLLKSGKQDRRFYRDMWETVTSGRIWTGLLTNRKKDGTLYIEKGMISPVLDDTGAVVNFVAVRTDVTEELRMKEKLGQAQKMEAIGTLAGGIAHDFNNILFPMVGFAEMLMEELPADSPLQDYAEDILSAALRAKDLVKQILDFSRQSTHERRAVRVHHILKEAIRLARAGLPSNIEVRQEISGMCPPILADPTQIHQIFMNLVTNAYHAMEATGGVLGISLDTADIDEKTGGELLLSPGRYVRLKVVDTGCGIDADVRDRIFEPYFTTKADGRGTGLGLSVIHGIVTSHQGGIKVESEPGRGSTFTVYLPGIKGFREATLPAAVLPIQGGRERILLVDDEAVIVDMAKKMLESLGYRVTPKTAGIEALQTFRDDPEGFDLVVTDMTMPNMTGDRLAAEIKRIRPDVPVILCTGFSSRMDRHRAAALGIEGFLLKPILRRDLAVTIRDVLDKSPLDQALSMEG